MDKIFIEDLEVFARHGVHQEENILGQKFVISAAMYTDTRAAGLTDDLSKSVNYAEVCQLIRRIMKDNTYRLIEAAAEKIAQAVLMGFPAVKKIKLTLKKPWAPVLLPLKNVGVSIERRIHTVYLGLGSNMGDKKAYLDTAISALEGMPLCRVCRVSDYIETEPWGYQEQDRFLNAVAEIETLLEPEALLEKLQEIERGAGRERKMRWGPRTLDIDILFYDELCYESERLIIPHPQITNRDFVLRPMNQLAPFLVHPALKKSIRRILQELRTEKTEA